MSNNPLLLTGSFKARSLHLTSIKCCLFSICKMVFKYICMAFNRMLSFMKRWISTISERVSHVVCSMHVLRIMQKGGKYAELSPRG